MEMNDEAREREREGTANESEMGQRGPTLSRSHGLSDPSAAAAAATVDERTDF